MHEAKRPPPPRRRAALLCVLGLVVALGLLSRRYALPGILAEHTGDALYTIAVFVALALILPTLSGRRLGFAALVASAAVECSQLVRWQWLEEIRATPVGALLLGQGWQWADLLAYAVGALLATGGDAVLRRRCSPGRNKSAGLVHDGGSDR